MEHTAARLRKTFQYKTDDNDSEDSLPDALDEEEQESLIQTLHAQNSLRNAHYTTAFLALPLLCALVYLVPLFRSSDDDDHHHHHHHHGGSSGSAVRGVLSLTSLSVSAYVLYFFPSPLSLLPWGSGGGGGGSGGVAVVPRRRDGDDGGADRRIVMATGKPGAGVFAGGIETRGPLEMYLPFLNAVLVVVLALAGFVGRQKEGEGTWFAVLPGLVLGFVVVAKGIMGSVNVGELEGLRYGYKGA